MSSEIYIICDACGTRQRDYQHKSENWAEIAFCSSKMPPDSLDLCELCADEIRRIIETRHQIATDKKISAITNQPPEIDNG